MWRRLGNGARVEGRPVGQLSIRPEFFDLLSQVFQSEVRNGDRKPASGEGASDKWQGVLAPVHGRKSVAGQVSEGVRCEQENGLTCVRKSGVRQRFETCVSKAKLAPG